MRKYKRIPPHVAERAATRYTTNENGCWESTYATDRQGYCKIGWRDNGSYFSSNVTRAAWVYHNGDEIPEGVAITQTCGNRKCVKPGHLAARDRSGETQCGEWAQGEDQPRPRGFCVSTGCLNPRREHERRTDPPGLCEHHYQLFLSQPSQRPKGVFVGYTLTREEIDQALDSPHLSAEQVAQRTGYSVEHVRRLRKQRSAVAA